MARIEDYGLIGDLADGGARQPRRRDRLALRARASTRARSSPRLLGDAENGHWTIQPAGEFRSTRRRYRGDTLVLETELETDERHRASDRLHAAARDEARHRPHRRRRPRPGRDARWSSSSASTTARSCRGCAPSTARSSRSPAPTRCCCARPSSTRAATSAPSRRSPSREGDRVPFVLDVVPVERAAARADRRGGGAGGDRRVLGGVGASVHVRGTLARRRAPLAPHAEGAHVRADRRDRRGADDVAAGVDRRRPQLGLPLLLAPRRDADAARVHPRRLRRGGRGVARLAPARDRGLAGGPADHVRRRRRERGSPSSSCRGSPATRVRGPCGSATARRISSSSTSTARSSTRSTRLGARASTRRTTPGRSHARCSTGSSPGWREADEGIWEVRGPRRHFTHSKVMAWVAFDRAVKTVERFGREGPLERWKAARKEIKDEVLREGYNAERGAFTQFFGSDRLDASCSSSRSSASCPRPTSASSGRFGAIERDLMRDGFVERYRADAENVDVDGLPPGEGAFLPCSFWLAAVLPPAGPPRRGRRAVRAAARAAERPGSHLGGVRPRARPPRRQLPAGVHAHRHRRDGVHARRGGPDARDREAAATRRGCP